MIFVTIGTTMPFDGLIRAMDALVAGGEISEPVICQIGNSDYVPEHCEHFRFHRGIDTWIDQASIIVAHGGTGSVLSLIAKQKKFVAVANPLGAGDHQRQFLLRLSKVAEILWTDDLANLGPLIREARRAELQPPSLPHLADDLKTYLSS